MLLTLTLRNKVMLTSLPEHTEAQLVKHIRLSIVSSPYTKLKEMVQQLMRSMKLNKSIVMEYQAIPTFISYRMATILSLIQSTNITLLNYMS